MGGMNSPGSKAASRAFLVTCLHIVPEIRMCGYVPKFLHMSLSLGVQLGTGQYFLQFNILFKIICPWKYSISYKITLQSIFWGFGTAYKNAIHILIFRVTDCNLLASGILPITLHLWFLPCNALSFFFFLSFFSIQYIVVGYLSFFTPTHALSHTTNYNLLSYIKIT
jgi:hypothetical protein